MRVGMMYVLVCVYLNVLWGFKPRPYNNGTYIRHSNIHALHWVTVLCGKFRRNGRKDNKPDPHGKATIRQGNGQGRWCTRIMGVAYWAVSFHVKQRGIFLTCTEEHAFSHVLNNIHVVDFISPMCEPCVQEISSSLPTEGRTAVHVGWSLSCLPGPVREGGGPQGACAVLVRVGTTFHASWLMPKDAG